ncbi:MAG TPA: ABC transporter ATP-binding protein [Xanthobacteraceae bacterium]|nr:ABC transporter ATP-binding protein [Xanthobacteraceae bacterium]
MVNAGPLLAVNGLEILFPTRDGLQTVKAVDGVDFIVRSGETFGVIGESGSGKTTLGRALVGLLAPTAGTILHDGIDLASLRHRQARHYRRNFQIVFQDPNAALDPRSTILESVREPLDLVGVGTREARSQQALAALDRVGLSAEIAARYPHELSGGQKQRVNIARVLTLRPKLIVCDEAVAGLDVSIRGEVLNLLAELQRDFGLTYVFITHDLSVVAHVSDRIAVMYLGKLMELGPAMDLVDRPLHPYTMALLSAEPIPLPSTLRRNRPVVLKGEIPSPIDPPSGCRFRTRCPHAQPICVDTVPDWRELASAHWVACHFAGQIGSDIVGTHQQ